MGIYFVKVSDDTPDLIGAIGEFSQDGSVMYGTITSDMIEDAGGAYLVYSGKAYAGVVTEPGTYGDFIAEETGLYIRYDPNNIDYIKITVPNT